MLLKIVCIVVLVAYPRVWGYDDISDEHSSEYRDEDGDDDFGGYHQGYDESDNPVRVKRFKAKQAAKTLSPLEIQQVKGAIEQILSGYNQDNPFTPLPPLQGSNEKRSIPESREIIKPQTAQTKQENYPFDTRTKFIEYTDVMDVTKLEPENFTNVPLTTDDATSKVSTLTTDEDYETHFNHGTINSLSSLPVIPGTIVVNPEIISATTDEVAIENDATAKTSEIINYETETNTGLTGATINVFPLTTTPPLARANTGDIKSEINNIQGRIIERADDDVTESESGLTTLSISGVEKLEEATPEGTVNVDASQTVKKNEEGEEVEETAPEGTVNVDASQTAKKNEEGEEVEEATPEGTVNVDASQTAKKNEEGEEVEETAPKGTVNVDASQTAKKNEEGEEVEETAPKGTVNVDASHTAKKKEDSEEGEEVEENALEGPEEYVDEVVSTRKPKRTKGRPGNKSVVIEFTKTRPRKTRTKRTTQTTTTKFKLDVPALLAIIANLTYDYEVNLTDKLNRTLHKYSIPTCETPTTTVKRGIFVDYDANATGTIVAKCFVCGLEVEGIPRNAYCADAFAGDFQPMMPADMTARGKLSKFRKYCRFADVPRYMWNISQPRSVFGRWTGGCSVRWIDLSGVYTQRSCRNRDRAILGRHYVSKRMAKLEMALKYTDNGCITSPMATLVPLSRGISLYARFHACVCTGSWCNAADIHIPWTGGGFLPLFVAYFSPYFIL